MMEQRLQTLNANQRAVVWAERITACRSSELSVRAWCRENQLSEKTYYYWQRRLFKLTTEQQPSFAELTPAIVRNRPDLAAKVWIGGSEAEIYNGADAGTIEVILQFLSHAE